MEIELLIQEFHNSQKEFFSCTDYHKALSQKIREKVKEVGLDKSRIIIDKEYKKNNTSILHNHLMVDYCQRIGVTLKDMLECRTILLRNYKASSVSFHIEAFISNVVFKDKSPIPASDANIEYERYFPQEKSDLWLVNLLLDKMVIEEGQALDIYAQQKEIGNGYGMRRAASVIK